MANLCNLPELKHQSLKKKKKRNGSFYACEKSEISCVLLDQDHLNYLLYRNFGVT